MSRNVKEKTQRRDARKAASPGRSDKPCRNCGAPSITEFNMVDRDGDALVRGIDLCAGCLEAFLLLHGTPALTGAIVYLCHKLEHETGQQWLPDKPNE